MPFCSQCGNKVGGEDAFCAACGSRQPAAGMRPGVGSNSAPQFKQPFTQTDPLANIPDRTFAVLCYAPVIGWVASVLVLVMRRFRGDFNMRFHAFQGLYIFAAWLIVDWAIKPFFSAVGQHVFRVDSLLEMLLTMVWIFMMVKTGQGETYELPLVGELAQRSAKEH
jgi:uncharacterized membrane protein